MRLIVASLAGMLAACANAATPAGTAECLDLLKDSRVTVSGRLTTQLFAGPPNFESIAQGDAEERAFILELPSRLCANDGDFIEPTESFDRVHLNGAEAAISAVLNSVVGRNVTVRGEAFGSHTGHHHAPLVMLVEEVT